MLSLKNVFLFLPLIVVGIFLLIWLYLSTERIPNLLVSIDNAQDEKFDYIIVGGGTAGCVLANRLSENGRFNVLLVEAGNVFSPLAMVPFLTSQQQKTQVDWQLQTTSQRFSSSGFIQSKQFLPRGKGLGGSSQINYLLHFDGNPKDFERWKANGQDIKSSWRKERFEWTDQSVGRNCDADDNNGVCTEKTARFAQKRFRENLLLKTNLHTTPITYDYSKLSSTFVDASNQLRRNYPDSLDYFLAKYNTMNGLRHSAYHSYLKPAFGRSNLKILLNTRVHRVIFDRKNAVQVLVSDDRFQSEPVKLRAKKEIIISAGAFHSPQLLKLSGVGPAKELKRNKIPLEYNSPKVGENLFDHINMPLYVTVNDTMSVTQAKLLNPMEILKYFIYGEGIFSNFGVIGYLNSLSDDFGVGIFGVGTIDARVLQSIVNYDIETFRTNFPFHDDNNQEGFVLLNICNQPLSRGTVELYSKNIQSQPQIDPNYLENQYDIECTIRAIRLAIDLLATEPFRRVNATIHWPKFQECKNFATDSNISDRYLECIIRVGGVTAHHPGGTCAIGNSKDSVVDSNMRVRGVKRLRVVDGSVLPSPVSGTPHTNIVAIAENAAQMILLSSGMLN